MMPQCLHLMIITTTTDTCNAAVAECCVGIDVNTQTIHDVSDAEMQICILNYHVAVQILQTVTTGVHKQILYFWL